ncbi:probable serine/threonine-protein kinase PIX13 [Punica granatum]|uniref:non-specific serine/threonine protein kinase n=1 Tax=Punica granatum TaxID=22663 RepID=A0A6P8BS37_PUNGR|nr:probable serine/threonine-protein kinase PIX13 [Punica granatum]
MPSEAERVLVIEDVSKNANLSAIRWVLRNISFQPGNQLMLLGVVHKIYNPMGYRSRVDPDSFSGANKKVVAETIASKKEVYLYNREIERFSDKCKTTKVVFHIDVQAGASPKELAVKAAQTFRATWVIIDKHMMKEKAYIVEQLACRISAIKHNNTIHDLHCPKAVNPQRQTTKINTGQNGRSQSEEFESCSVCKNKRPKIGWKREFTIAELQISTEGFSRKNLVSENGFCFMYRGMLSGLEVAVHKIKNTSFSAEEEFLSKITEVSRVRHENLVTLWGVCSEGSNMLLVYEHICNGSLEQHLSKNHHRPLSWDRRMKIAIGASRGLKYLHQNAIIHGNLRLDNIFITHDYEPLVGEFGLPIIEHDDSDLSSETRLGNGAYYTPEYVEFGKISAKTDCYCFGVVLLQLITGLRTTDPILGGKSLVAWARPLLRDKNYPGLLDRRIGDSYNVHQLFWMVRVAEKCLCRNPRNRMTMDKAVYTLTCMMKGNTVPVIRTFSPALSESLSSSIMDSSGSACDDRSSSTQDQAPSMRSMDNVTRKLPPSTLSEQASSSRSVPSRKTFKSKPALVGQRAR